MASPIAHTLAGASIYYLACKKTGVSWWFFLVIIVAASLPDFDLIPGLILGNSDIFHRTVSHSIYAAIFSGVLFFICLKALAIDLALTRSIVWTTAVLSHLVIDWLTFDNVSPQGIAALWPVSDIFFMSNTTIFMHIERHNLFDPDTIIHNLTAGLLELIILLPMALVIRKLLFRPVYAGESVRN